LGEWQWQWRVFVVDELGQIDIQTPVPAADFAQSGFIVVRFDEFYSKQQ